MIKDVRYKGHLPTISGFDFLSYCLLHGITPLVISRYEDRTYGPHSMDGPRCTAEAGIGFIWLGVRMDGVWGWVRWSLTSTATPTQCLAMADPTLLRRLRPVVAGSYTSEIRPRYCKSPRLYANTSTTILHEVALYFWG